jgi:cation:H+ antiporter
VVGYTFAVVAAFVPSRGLRIGIALGLVGLYVVYVRQTLAAGQLIIGEDLDRLHLKGLLTGGERPFPAFGSGIVPIDEPPLWMVATQTVFALLVIVAGAHLFVTEVEFFSTEVLDVPAASIALLLALLATELPEKFNSIIWISESKDILAIGNITGAMVFQGTLPATLGILFTSWDLGVTWGTIGFLNTLSAVLALVGGGAVLLRTQFMAENRMRPAPFLVAGLLYVVFITVVIYHVVVLGVAAGH